MYSVNHLCSCGAQAMFYCSDEQIYLCLPHRNLHKSDHSIYFNKGKIKQKEKSDLLKSLTALKENCEVEQMKFQTHIDNIYSKLNNIFQAKYSILESSLSAINQFIDILENTEDYCEAFPFFTLLQENPKSLIKSIPSRLHVFINSNYFSKLENSIKVTSTLSDFLFESPQFPPPSELYARSLTQLYEVKKTAESYHPANSDQVSEWFQSISILRNLSLFRSLSINGDLIDKYSLDGYSLIPTVFHLKDLSLVSFNAKDFTDISSKVIAKCSSLSKLQIENCEVTEGAANFLSEYLKSCQGFKEIVISHCLSGDLISRIPAKMDLGYLSTLVLSKAKIGDEGLEAICELFPKMCSLKYLHLDGNEFSLQGGVFLTVYLPFLQDLLDINLSQNKIGLCAGAILRCLACIGKVRVINISSVNLPDTQFDLVLEQLKKFKYLESIYFDMTLPDNFLSRIKQILPAFSHVYRDDPEQQKVFEFR